MFSHDHLEKVFHGTTPHLFLAAPVFQLDDDRALSVFPRVNKNQVFSAVFARGRKSYVETQSLKYPLRRYRVPMSASRLWSVRPTYKWQHLLSSRTPTGTELAPRQLIKSANRNTVASSEEAQRFQTTLQGNEVAKH